VTYRLAVAARRSAEQRARSIALEQTVELPADCLDPEVERTVVGRVEAVEPLERSGWRCVISYEPAIVGGELSQLLNLLFGNISLQRGIRVSAIDWPETLLRRFAGPRLGIDGLRQRVGVVERRPLVCTALKPVGLSAVELARRAREFALAGIDLIKDDHGLANQATAPFDERLGRCLDAVQEANARSGGGSLYLPHLTGPVETIDRRAEQARARGCRGALISPLLAGPETVGWIAARHDFAVLAHPAMSGAYFAPDHGIAAELLLGQLFRIGGADGVIYPNAGGRFPLEERTCAAINDALRGPLGSLRPAFPVPAGGIDVARVPHWIERYGAETILLIGGSLYRQKDLVAAGRRLLEAVRRGC
jgi:ribulose-bisphosphate carboxylase large chain